MKIKSIVDAVQHGIDLLKGEESIDKTYHSQHTHPDETTARQALARAKEKLFEVNQWSEISSITADFFLHDSNGQPKPTGKVAVGDYVKIVLPGPGPENWVYVIQVVDEANKAEFTARPSANPLEQKQQTEHFFSESATSTFRVELAGTTITASQIGQNESVNNQEPQAGDRAVVNTLIASGGWLFYQKIQWQMLTDYLVDG